MKEEIINTLTQLEKDLVIYHKAAQDPDISDLHKGPVSFKFMYEMIRYTILKNLVPEYQSNNTSEVLVAYGVGENAKLVYIQDDKVVVSPQFEELIKLQKQYKDGKIS